MHRRSPWGRKGGRQIDGETGQKEEGEEAGRLRDPPRHRVPDSLEDSQALPRVMITETPPTVAQNP